MEILENVEKLKTPIILFQKEREIARLDRSMDKAVNKANELIGLMSFLKPTDEQIIEYFEGNNYDSRRFLRSLSMSVELIPNQHQDKEIAIHNAKYITIFEDYTVIVKNGKAVRNDEYYNNQIKLYQHLIETKQGLELYEKIKQITDAVNVKFAKLKKEYPLLDFEKVNSIIEYDDNKQLKPYDILDYDKYSKK